MATVFKIYSILFLWLIIFCVRSFKILNTDTRRHLSTVRSTRLGHDGKFPLAMLEVVYVHVDLNIPHQKLQAVQVRRYWYCTVQVYYRQVRTEMERGVGLVLIQYGTGKLAQNEE